MTFLAHTSRSTRSKKKSQHFARAGAAKWIPQLWTVCRSGSAITGVTLTPPPPRKVSWHPSRHQAKCMVAPTTTQVSNNNRCHQLNQWLVLFIWIGLGLGFRARVRVRVCRCTWSRSLLLRIKGFCTRNVARGLPPPSCFVLLFFSFL